MDKRYCQVCWLGQISYADASKLQKELVAKRTTATIPDTLLLLEHFPTYTVGLGSHREHLLISPEEMRQRKIAYHAVERGGSIMYHGPGQLVAYPILNLQNYHYNYHTYIQMLEKVTIHTLTHFHIHAFQKQDYSGVWVLSKQAASPRNRWLQPDNELSKIASVGIKIDQNYVSSHGFFINVNPGLEFFKLIMPPSLQERNVTSIQQVLNRQVDIKTVLDYVVSSFSEIFEVELITDRLHESGLAAV